MKFITIFSHYKMFFFAMLIIEVSLFSLLFWEKQNHIKDIITGTTNNYIHQINYDFWIEFFSLSMVMLLLFANYLRSKIFRQKLKNQNKKLSLAKTKLKTIIDSQNNMIVITDGEKMIDMNKKVVDFFGFTCVDEMISSHSCICTFFLKHKNYFYLDRVPKDVDWISYIQTLPSDKRVVNMIGVDMEAKAFQIHVDHYGSEGGSILTFNDITEILIQQKVLEHKAQHDCLTGIYNRQKIDEVLHKLCKFSGRRKEEIGLIMFDIDHFKKVNDNYGHDVGDEVLKEITNFVKKSIREGDIFGRWGGEEFVIILRHTNIEDTHKKALRLCKSIENFQKEGIPKITISIGLTKLNKNDHPKSLLKRADLALYQAKAQGRNQAIRFSKELQTKNILSKSL